MPAEPLAPIHALLKRGICGRFWQCRRCNYWCYTDPEIRRHEAKFHDYDVSEEDEEEEAVALRADTALALRLRRREMEEAERRKRRRAEEERRVRTEQRAGKRKRLLKDIRKKKGDHFRCLRCSYWCYPRGGMILHEKRNRCNKD